MKKSSSEHKKRKTTAELVELARLCRGDIIKMTTIAGSGHPAGSMSSIDIYLALFNYAKVSPMTYDDPKRDRIIISHGHTSPALYACLARYGFVDLRGVLTGFRRLGSPFEGHIESSVPGVEWSTGNLGQGLSAGCGFALASRLTRGNYNTYVVMSDAEQAKGQVGEARRFARKYDLSNLTVIIDNNHFQISGRTEKVMPVNIRENYQADGWKVIKVNGHNFSALNRALRQAKKDKLNPYVIIANTTMGNGVSFMENTEKYHGSAPSRDESIAALKELGVDNDIDELIEHRSNTVFEKFSRKKIPLPEIKIGKSRLYEEKTHPRNAFGSALTDIASLNPNASIAVFDCDLADSVRVKDFAKIRPESFFEAGVSEHTTATIAGAASINGILSIWADFGVFAIDEVYNQLRLNDINDTNIKIIATHLGYNVGPDGKTHHCIDYIGLLRNLFGFNLIIPGDPNQTDHVIRYILSHPGNHVVGISRTKLPIIKNEDGHILFDEKYEYMYGKIDLIREGNDCTLFTYGPMLNNAIIAWEKLKEKGISMRIYNISSPLSLDRDIIIEAAATQFVVTYEDHIINSGLGSSIGQVIAENRLSTDFVKIGIEQYGDSGDSDALYKKYSLNSDALVKKIEARLLR
jgi:transketolase